MMWERKREWKAIPAGKPEYLLPSTQATEWGKERIFTKPQILLSEWDWIETFKNLKATSWMRDSNQEKSNEWFHRKVTENIRKK